MKKTLMLSAAAAAFLLAGGGAAWAQCDLPNTNWTCQEVVTETTEVVETRHGQSDRCEIADRTVTTTEFRAINPGNQHVDTHDGPTTVVAGDPVRREGGAGNQPCSEGTP